MSDTRAHLDRSVEEIHIIQMSKDQLLAAIAAYPYKPLSTQRERTLYAPRHFVIDRSVSPNLESISGFQIKMIAPGTEAPFEI